MSASTDAGPERRGQRIMGASRGVVLRTVTTLFIFVFSHTSFNPGWGSPILEAAGPSMGRDMPQSFERHRGLPAETESGGKIQQTWERRTRRSEPSRKWRRCLRKEKAQSQAKSQSCRGGSRVDANAPELETGNDAMQEGGRRSAPGTTASTVRVHALLNSFPRWLLRIPCGLQRFLRSILASPGCADDPTSSTSSVWPMPLPYPEVFRSGASTVSDCPLKRLVSLEVAAFDWLCLNLPDAAPCSLRIGARLSARQWTVVKKMMQLVVDGNTPEFVTATDMGRAAVKMEKFQDRIAVLARSLAEVHDVERPYFSEKHSRPEAFEGSLRCGQVCGETEAGVESVAKPLVADRLKFANEPFDPRRFFDDSTLDLYDYPLSHGHDPEQLPAPPQVKVRASRKEKLELFRKMARCSMIQPVEPGTFPDRYRSGLFAVPKDAEKDRMVLDGRPANLVDRGQTKWSKAMASSTVLSQMHIEADKVLVMAGEDLKDFFYQFLVNEERTSRNALAGDLSLDEAAYVFGPGFQWPHGRVSVGLATLAMGDKSVLVNTHNVRTWACACRVESAVRTK